jgi:methylase of polypeptide subunit release factors
MFFLTYWTYKLEFYTMPQTIDQRLEYLLSEHRHLPFISDEFVDIGLPTLHIGEHVLRPDRSYVSKYLTRWLVSNPWVYSGKKVLEIGCGSGVQSVAMAWMGAKNVLATDISDWAISSCDLNIRRLQLQKIISTRRGDLFQPLTKDERFDVAIFNHPFFKGKPKSEDPFEIALLDDRELAGIFLDKIWNFMSPNGIVLMPYSEICGDWNDPRRFAKQLGLVENQLYNYSDEDGAHIILRFSRHPDQRYLTIMLSLAHSLRLRTRLYKTLSCL